MYKQPNTVKFRLIFFIIMKENTDAMANTETTTYFLSGKLSPFKILIQHKSWLEIWVDCNNLAYI